MLRTVRPISLRRFAVLALAALIASGPAAAQFGPPAEPCPEGEAQAWLRGAEVQAALFTNGNLFFGNTTTAGDGYLVPLGQTGPNGAPASPMFAANLWVGGRVGDEVRTAAALWTGFQFRPGRTGLDRIPPDSTACAAADRIWAVARSDVEAFLAGAPPTVDLRDWPVDLGAPVLDGDGVEGNYDLAAGDQPAIRGDVTAFWAMTDTAAERWGDEAPVGVDVAVEAFAFREARLGRHTFYRFTVTNRNAVPLDSAYVGLYHDWDLGGPSDDYVGTDTTAHMAFVYNATEVDRVYGVPPAFGVVLAEGPVGLPNGRDDDRDGVVDEPAERLGLTHVPVIWKNGPDGLPATVEQVYYRLQGLMNDGTPIRAMGSGYGPQRGAPTTAYGVPGDPVTEAFWSEVNNDGSGTDNGTGDRWGMLPAGPFRLEPDSSATVTFALVFAQGADRFDSVLRLRGQARGVRAGVLGGTFDPVRAGPGTLTPVPLAVRRPAPNPFRVASTLVIEELSIDSPVAVRVDVFDVLGRRVSAETVVAAPGREVEVGRGLAPGVYLVRVSGPGFAETFPTTKIR